MKLFALAAAVAMSLALPLAHAQMSGMKGMDMKDMKSDKADGKVHDASGTVRKVDADKGATTIAHGPVPSLNWPSMTMSFVVKDKAMLDKLKPGAKIEFKFIQSGKDYVITELK